MLAGDGNPLVVAQFSSILEGAYTNAKDGGRKGDDFKALIQQMAGAVGRDISSLSHSAQAAAVAAWMKKTRPPIGLEPYVADPSVEIDLRMHNSFWGWTDDEYSQCQVVGYVGNFTFPNGTTCKHTYVIECEGHHYPAKHGTVADALADAATRRRVLKAPPPRLL